MIVMSILIILVGVAIGTLNPIANINKANDARRKKDLNRLRTAYEEYFSDKGYYPPHTEIDTVVCGSNWRGLNPFPCDPVSHKPYIVLLDGDDYTANSAAPRWFKIYTNLSYKKDPDIPEGWYDSPRFLDWNNFISNQTVNYGVSSSNVNWYDKSTPEYNLSNCSGTVCTVLGTGPNGETTCNYVSSCVDNPTARCYASDSCKVGCGRKRCP